MCPHQGRTRARLVQQRAGADLLPLEAHEGREHRERQAAGGLVLGVELAPVREKAVAGGLGGLLAVK
jgi:hypothetical protein